MDEQLFERIKQYKNRQMSEEGRLAFENQLKTDPVFAEEVAFWAAIQQGIQDKGDVTLNDELMGLGKQLLQTEAGTPEMTAQVNQDKLASRRAVPRWAFAAAAMLLLLLIAWPVYQRLSGPETTYALAQTLYSEHFSLPPASILRGTSINQWQEAYEQKQFPQAIAALEGMLADSSFKRRSEAFLFLGICHLGMEQPQEALTALEQVSPDSFAWEDAQWYTSMAYLKLGDSAKAITYLKNIAGQANQVRKEEAGQILKRLK